MHGFHCSFLLLLLLVMFPYNAKHRGSCPEVFCKKVLLKIVAALIKKDTFKDVFL